MEEAKHSGTTHTPSAPNILLSRTVKLMGLCVLVTYINECGLSSTSELNYAVGVRLSSKDTQCAHIHTERNAVAMFHMDGHLSKY